MCNSWFWIILVVWFIFGRNNECDNGCAYDNNGCYNVNTTVHRNTNNGCGCGCVETVTTNNGCGCTQATTTNNGCNTCY